jgi:UDP:flavonoid glycosyltransferase YjiC (YdhE family)
MSPYRKIPFYSLSPRLDSAWAKWLAAPIDATENAIETFFYDRVVMSGLNRLRRELGLNRIYGYEHEEGGLSLLADIPEFNPVRSLQPHARFIGPLTWHNELPPPACLQKLDKDRKTVYFTLGSEGLEELVEQFGALTGKGLQIVVATGKTNRVVGRQLTPNVFFEEYVNTDELLPRCDIICCHGGNGTLYQALAYGLPIVAVATHAEQYYGARRIQQLGLGRALTLKMVRRAGIRILIEAVLQVLEDPGYRERAQAFSRHLLDWNGAERAALEIADYGTAP